MHLYSPRKRSDRDMAKLRVLLITRECLRTDSNEGNLLINLFAGQDMELANIYCKPGLPDTDLCGNRYFQLTDKMALQNLLRKTPMGNQVEPDSPKAESTQAAEKENKRFYDFFRSHNWTLFHCARELLWRLSDFKSEQLRRFVLDFAPDVIFAPLCYSRFVLAVHRYVIDLCKAPAVTYIYDDLYSFKQLSFSPLFWLNRFMQRGAIRRALPYYSYAYTMSEQQAAEFSKLHDIELKVLRKCAAVSCENQESKPRKEVRLIYAGGVYFGREKTLVKVADAVRKLRSEGEQVKLDIYTSSPLSRNDASRLNDNDGCRVLPAIPFDKLRDAYSSSDIALHVESFERRNALTTRLSFSTKIVDCLGSGCAVLAICPDFNTGWRYLRDEDAAICVSAPDDVEAAIRRLVSDESLRKSYAQKALNCAVKNHDASSIRANLANELETLAQVRGVGI